MRVSPVSRVAAVLGLMGGAVALHPMLGAAEAVPVGVLEYVVATTSDPLTTPDPVTGVCTLREAIRTAGLMDTTTTACGPGAWHDTGRDYGDGSPVLSNKTAHITFAGAGRGVIALADQLILPQVEGGEIWLDGAGEPGEPKVVLSGQDQHRILWADTWPETGSIDASLNGTLILRDLTFTHGRAILGTARGGALRTGFRMALDIDRVTFSHNEATAGSAIYSLGPAKIRNSTFAYNHARGQDAPRTAAITVINFETEIFGSTFLNNTSAAPGTARDIVVTTGAFANAAQLELGYNVFIAPQGDDNPSCDLEGIDQRSVFGRENLASHGSVLGRCYTAMGGMGGGRHAVLQPVPNGQGAELADHGGWVDSVLLTAGSENHDLPGGALPDYCSVFLATPTRPDLDPRATDVRGVARPTGACDAGAIQRDEQLLDFPQPVDGTTYVGADFPEPTATSRGAVGLVAGPVETCSVVDGQVNLLALGTCEVTASQAGTDLFRAADSVSRTFSVTKTPRTVSFTRAPASGRVGGTWAIAVSTTDGSTPTYTATADVCSVTGTTLSFDAPGTCTVRAELPETATAEAAFAEVSIDVQPLIIQAISWNPATPTARLGETLTLRAAGGASGEPVIVTGPPIPRKGKAVCTITSQTRSGSTTTVTVAFRATGTCSLRADQAGTSDYAAAQSTLSFSVLKKRR